MIFNYDNLKLIASRYLKTFCLIVKHHSIPQFEMIMSQIKCDFEWLEKHCISALNAIIRAVDILLNCHPQINSPSWWKATILFCFLLWFYFCFSLSKEMRHQLWEEPIKMSSWMFRKFDLSLFFTFFHDFVMISDHSSRWNWAVIQTWLIYESMSSAEW